VSTTEQRLLTVEEVARRCTVSKDTIYRAVKAGRLRAVWLGPHVLRFRPEDVEAWIEGGR
jgi:excisionase family DNA binding protein